MTWRTDGRMGRQSVLMSAFPSGKGVKDLENDNFFILLKYSKIFIINATKKHVFNAYYSVLIWKFCTHLVETRHNNLRIFSSIKNEYFSLYALIQHIKFTYIHSHMSLWKLHLNMLNTLQTKKDDDETRKSFCCFLTHTKFNSYQFVSASSFSSFFTYLLTHCVIEYVL